MSALDVNINSEQLQKDRVQFLKTEMMKGRKLVKKCQYSKFAQTITTSTNVLHLF